MSARTRVSNGENSTAVTSRASNSTNVNTLFVIGLPRSGTTLLAHMLAGGDGVLSLSEPFLSLSARRHRLLNWLYFPTIRKSRIVPPRNCDEIGFLNYLKDFSGALGFSFLIIKETYRQKPCLENTGMINLMAATGVPVIAITRHPYDIAASTLSFFRQLRGVKGRLTQMIVSGFHIFSDDREVVEWLSNNWLSFTYWCKQNRPLVVRYEDLVRDPLPRLQEICSRCDIPFSREMLNNKHPRFYSGMSGDPGGLEKHKENLFVRPVGNRNLLKSEFTEIIKSACNEAAEEAGYTL